MDGKEIKTDFLPLDHDTNAYIAHGLDNLLKILTDLANTSCHECFILHQLRSHQSLTKMMIEKDHYHFYYYNLLGRPILEREKDVIARVVWDKQGKDEYLKNRPSHLTAEEMENDYQQWKNENWRSFITDESANELFKKQAPFLQGGDFLVESFQDTSLDHAFTKLKASKFVPSLQQENKAPAGQYTGLAFFSTNRPSLPSHSVNLDHQEINDKGMKK